MANRELITLSLPADLKRFVDRAVREGSYSSKSEFLRDLIRQRKETRILEELRESERELQRDKGRVVHSLKSLR